MSKQEIVERAEPAPVADAFVAMIERAAANPAVDVEKLERLLAMRERMEARAAERAFAEAMAEMQPQLPTISADAQIVHNNKIISQYARWEDINEIIRPILARHGFALDFSTASIDGGIAVTAHLSHRTGYSKSATVPLPIDMSGAKNSIQGIGSSITYGKRYSAGLVLNLTSRAPGDADDDGKAAGLGIVITPEQVETLRAEIVETGADLAAFLKYFRVERLEDLPASQFDRARAALEKKKAAK